MKENVKQYFLKWVIFLAVGIMNIAAYGEDGSRLWLRYDLLPDSLSKSYIEAFHSVTFPENTATRKVAATELERAFAGLTGHSLYGNGKVEAASLIVGTGNEKVVKQFHLEKELDRCGDEGYVLKTITINGDKMTVLAANSDAGLLYGTFALIRLMQTGASVNNLDIVESPKYQLRLLNHWDNLDGTVERGYAGLSIFWNQQEDSANVHQRFVDYARANASVGINGAVLNNVNAAPKVLTAEYIHKTAKIADVLRPYHVKVYLSVNFSSPMVLDSLPTADPLDKKVIQWWKKKVDEIYQAIPDFGGFLVKANSEGQPGPQNFGRTHADGANMLADALKPHGGVVMWRAFVYSPNDADRAMQAYNEFKPLDGKFADNVIIQIKNGPIDFQPREPFSPLFGALDHTSEMIEFQITQEYLGQETSLAYLAPLQKECLESDTWSQGKGSTVARVTDGSLYHNKITAIAGVANVGDDTNWTGHPFAQANWYAYGRLAWNHELTARDIAKEWIIMTFSHSTEFIKPALDMMMRSREAIVNYMTPLGLAHLMGWSNHYGPQPWCQIKGARADWLPPYYHRAAEDGIGFDRTENGSKAVDQYFSPLKEYYNNLQTCPDELLLWFHHLPWEYTMHSGKTLWEELCYHYYAGVDEVRLFQKKWDRLKGLIDNERFNLVQQKLKTQEKEAEWWRDACLLYFQTFSHRPIPKELERPVHDLKKLMEPKFNVKKTK